MPKVLDTKILLFAAFGIAGGPPLYYWIGRTAHENVLLLELYFWTAIFVVALLAGYEFFFAVQTINLDRRTRIIFDRLDDRFPFVVQWVWIYSVLYYVLLGLPLSFITHIEQCLACIAGGFAILLLSSIVYLIWPTRCPPKWRDYRVDGPSSRLLAFVQRLDQGRNCNPSLHCTLAAYTASFVPSPLLVVGIPALISLSCLFVKQHSVRDLPGSLVFGFAMGAFVNHMI
jgi:hypothetical protein